MRPACCALLLGLVLTARPAGAQPLPLLDVPYLSQSEALCGGAAAAMVLRYWGAQGLTAESFASLVDRSAAGIRTDALVGELARRGYTAAGVAGTDVLLMSELNRGRPVIALIEDRPGTYHYVVVVGWHARGVVFHDPARAPFQVMSRADFDRRWDAAAAWMLVLTPPPAAGAAAPAPAVPAPALVPTSSCDQQIAQGVREAQGNQLDAAERTLTAAVSCPGGAAYRELAGVRLLQRRWPEVEHLAGAALAEDPADVQSWKLLGTARFVGGDTGGALDAWNHAQEPKVDLIRVDGLRRTRQRAVERFVDVPIGAMLTSPLLNRTRRRVGEWPSAAAATATFVPAGNGLAQLRVSMVERDLLPRGWLALAALGVRAVAAREVEIGSNSLTGGGERLAATWRFWPHRPRYALSASAAGPRGLRWTIEGSAERQPLTGGIAAASHRAARVSVSRWEAAGVRWSAGGGWHRWRDRGSYGAAGGGVRFVSPGDRLDLRGDAHAWRGDGTFAAWQASARGRTSTERDAVVLIGRMSAGGTSVETPHDLWMAGDTGHARDTPLRAHPLVDDGRFRAERLGRLIAAASVEGQWWFRRGLLRWAPAAFVDVARTAKRVAGAPITDVDVGLGVRLAAPGIGGTLRLDLARGLHDGATALSLVYEP